jgi:hypothetical protein
MTDINEWSRITDPDGNQLYGVYLYKTEFTIPVGETTLSFGPANGIVGTVVACWLDPTTLTAAATIKGYQVDDDLATLGPDYFIDYTVPNPAVETRSLRAKRMFVVGNIVIDIAGATAGDAGVIYVFVSTNADAEQASIDIGDVTLLAGTALIGKVELYPAAYGARVSVTRPANETPYTAGDVVGAAAAALTFPIAPAAGGEVLITSAALEVDVTAVPAGMTAFVLHLYDVTPPSALADNAAWDLPAGDRASYLGSINLGSPVDVGSTLRVQQDGLNMQITALGANVYGYLQTITGFTPASATVKAVSLHSVRL